MPISSSTTALTVTAFRPQPFFNRLHELAALDRAWRQATRQGQMALVYGRRRVGKTYLLQHFFGVDPLDPESGKRHCYSLAEQTTAPAQRAALAAQVLEALPDAGVSEAELAVSWNAILRHVSSHCLSLSGQGQYKGEQNREEQSKQPFGLILDEFPYLVAQSPELPSVLQAWWDREGIGARLLIVLCGSQLSAMEALGAESAPLFGRFNGGRLLLTPLSYEDVAAFYSSSHIYGLRETLIMYGALGGTPRYHALVDTTRPMNEEIVDLLMRPRSPLETEIRFLLTSEQIRDPAPYNAVLGAVAAGHTQFSELQQQTHTETAGLSYSLRTLISLGWLRREFPFEETREKRAQYRIADPFVTFWYRFVAPLSSVLQFSDPAQVYAGRVAPFLADYMGRYVFEDICHQWLRRHAGEHLGLTIQDAGRWWSRDGRVELDIVARLDRVHLDRVHLDGGNYLYGECKWIQDRSVGLAVYSALLAKVAQLPRDEQKRDARFVLFSVGGFSPDLETLAADPTSRLHLVKGSDLLLPDIQS